ncbi:unnamed protein product, partial [Symbiodinium necroappetens]
MCNLGGKGPQRRCCTRARQREAVRLAAPAPEAAPFTGLKKKGFPARDLIEETPSPSACATSLTASKALYAQQGLSASRFIHDDPCFTTTVVFGCLLSGCRRSRLAALRLCGASHGFCLRALAH